MGAQHRDLGNYIAKTFHGLEELLADELRQIGANDVQVITRGVEFDGDKEVMYKANLHSRLALRILKPIHKFRARTDKELYDGVRKLDWSRYFSPDETIAIDSVVFSEFFNHSQYVALKVKDAIVDQFRETVGRRPSVDTENPDFKIHLHIRENQCTLLFDSSGDALYKRGYRDSGHIAPLSEVLGAGMLMHAGWTGERPLLDPMCGSGTILIEAAMIAANKAPGSYRTQFGFMKWKDFDKELWDKLTADAKAQERPITTPILGSDNFGRALGSARANLSKAGFLDDVGVTLKDFEELRPPRTPGLLITNPPYGERLQNFDVNEFYTTIGDQLKRSYAGWEAWLISNNMEALKHVGLRPSKKIILFNGSLECRFQRYDLYDGSKKHSKQGQEFKPVERKVEIPAAKPAEEHIERKKETPAPKPAEEHIERNEEAPVPKAVEPKVERPRRPRKEQEDKPKTGGDYPFKIGRSDD